VDAAVKREPEGRTLKLGGSAFLDATEEELASELSWGGKEIDRSEDALVGEGLSLRQRRYAAECVAEWARKSGKLREQSSLSKRGKYALGEFILWKAARAMRSGAASVSGGEAGQR